MTSGAGTARTASPAGVDRRFTSPPNSSFAPTVSGATRQPAAQPPVTVAQPAAPQVPPEVLAYLSWLAQQNAARMQQEAESQSQLPALMGRLVTPGGIDASSEPGGEDPARQNARLFDQWSARLSSLHRNFTSLAGLDHFWRHVASPGSPHVPQRCALLHGAYSQALGLQVDATREVAAAMASKDAGAATRDMVGSNRAQELLARADAELGRISAFYGVPQWFHISVTPAETPLPPVLPR
jgi:hypothetical protein